MKHYIEFAYKDRCDHYMSIN